VRVFVRVRATGSPGGVARKFKGRTSRVWRGEFVWLGRCRVPWPESCLAVPVGYGLEAAVRRYVEHRWDAVA
jgi:REP element-mobilizing transposase RayT